MLDRKSRLMKDVPSLYCSPARLRAILMIVNAVVLILGIMLIGFGAYAANATEIKKTMGAYPGVLVALAGSFIFVVAFVGCWAAKTVSPVLLGCYAVVMLILSSIIIAMGSTLAAYSNTLSKDARESCSTLAGSTSIADFETTMTNVQEFYALCKTPSVVKVTDCSEYPAKFGGNDDASFLQYLETSYNCSGFCSPGPFMYTGQTGNATQGCIVSLAAALEPKASLASGAFIAIGVILLLLTVFSCCLLCHPDRKEYKADLGAGTVEMGGY